MLTPVCHLLNRFYQEFTAPVGLTWTQTRIHNPSDADGGTGIRGGEGVCGGVGGGGGAFTYGLFDSHITDVLLLCVTLTYLGNVGTNRPPASFPEGMKESRE